MGGRLEWGSKKLQENIIGRAKKKKNTAKTKPTKQKFGKENPLASIHSVKHPGYTRRRDRKRKKTPKPSQPKEKHPKNIPLQEKKKKLTWTRWVNTTTTRKSTETGGKKCKIS